MIVEGSPNIKIANVEPEQYIPDTRIQNEELYLVTNVTRLELHCEAHFPVQWDFAGDTVSLLQGGCHVYFNNSIST